MLPLARDRGVHLELAHSKHVRAMTRDLQTHVPRLRTRLHISPAVPTPWLWTLLLRPDLCVHSVRVLPRLRLATMRALLTRARQLLTTQHMNLVVLIQWLLMLLWEQVHCVRWALALSKHYRVTRLSPNTIRQQLIRL